MAQAEWQEVGSGLVARPAVQCLGLCPGAQYAVDMAILGTGGVKGLAEGVDAHGKNSGPAGPGNQWQPALATGAGGFSLARSAALASIQFFQAIMQPSRMKAPGGSRASRKPG